MTLSFAVGRSFSAGDRHAFRRGFRQATVANANFVCQVQSRYSHAILTLYSGIANQNHRHNIKLNC